MLASRVEKHKIVYFEADHIINKENVMVRILKNDVSEKKSIIKFNYETFLKNSEGNIKQVYGIIDYFYNNISGGIVVFMQNYEILSKLKKYIKEQNVIPIENFFFEEKINNINTFSLYQNYINHKKKGILIAIIGGKLSEGINFNDDLARCVIIVGLPYPSINSLDIKLKMEYYDKMKKKNASEINGNDYYENLCMKAVNQSIGRAIRHKDDYSIIILADIRFGNEKVINKLPRWIINSGVEEVSNMGKLKKEIESFFSLHIERINKLK